MLYPLFFPYGRPGWNTEMMHSDGKDGTMMLKNGKKHHRLTMREFVAHRIQWRPKGEWTPFRFAGMLQQAYLVDNYSRIEAQNLEYLRQNQQVLKVAQYKNLMDHIANRSEEMGVAPGTVKKFR
jgi:hypothetical protein